MKIPLPTILQPHDEFIVGHDTIGGEVKGDQGPEAGVWVIAQTADLPTRFTKIVVTDEKGRFLVPDLPKGNYRIWVRGYGLVDSPKLDATLGARVVIKATAAPTAAAAAEYYPPIYWYSMLDIPAPTEFPGTGDGGNGIATGMSSQGEWLNSVKTNGCIACHALGTKATRTMPKDFTHYASSREAWMRRISSGQAMTNMISVTSRLGTGRAIATWSDWTDRIAAGELPFAKPRRPEGVERNVVLTLWDWSRNTAYLHDLIGTDKRKPTVNAHGPFYGATENSTDFVPVLEPARNRAREILHPVRDPKGTPSHKTDPMLPSPYWGDKPIWDSQASLHNPMMDERERVWFTARIRGPQNPRFCGKGSAHPSAQVFPLERSTRHLSMYDPKLGRFTLIGTCFPTHHLIFAEDANHTLWTSSGGPGNQVLGWLDRKRFDETGDEAASQGWTPFVLDTNGNGKRDEWTEPGQPRDPKKDQRLAIGIYSVAVSPVDASIWGTVVGYPGYIARVAPGTDPTHTALTEIYQPPFPGYGPRGGDIDRNGVFWASLASGHLASFDRRKCTAPLNGPGAAAGQHCPEGWTLHAMPGPQFRGVSDPGSAESSYYTWVDQFDALGLGRNVPIATGNLNDSLMALVDGKFVNMVVPYPIGFFTKWVEGRIDDPTGGWRGRALWASYSTRTMFHLEGGTQNRPKVVRFQLRPNPLAR